MCAREQGYILCASQGRGIYCVPHKTGVCILCLLDHRVFNLCLTRMWISILCFLGHKLSNMCLTWQWVFILCSTAQGLSIGWLTEQGILFCAFWDTGFLIWASRGRGCLLCAQQGWGIYCLPHRTGCLFCASWGTGYLICDSHVCGCLFCASWDTGGSNTFHTGHCMPVVCVTGQQISIMRARELGCLLCVPQGGVSIVCVSQDRCVYSVLPGAQCL